MGNAKSHTNYTNTQSTRRKRYDEYLTQRGSNSLASGIYPHTNEVHGPIRFHSTHGENISITNGGKDASRTNSFCFAVAFTSRPIKQLEVVRFRLETVNKGWSGVMRFGFISENPLYMTSNELPRYVCPDLTNRNGCWAKAIQEDCAQEGNVFSFYFNYDGTVFYSVNDEPKGVFLEKMDVMSPVWGVFDVYGNTTSLRLMDENDSTRHSLNTSTRLSRRVTPRLRRPISLPPNMQEQLVSRLSISETLEPILFSATMGLQLKCRNLTHITRQADIMESALAFTSTALSAGQTAYFYCAERKPNEIPAFESMGFGIGVTICDPSKVKIEDLPFDSEMVMDRSEYWILFRDFEPPQESEFFAIKIEKDGCLSYMREGNDKTTLFYMDVSQPLYIVIDLCSKVSSLAIVAMSSEPETEIADSFEFDINSLNFNNSIFHHNLSSDILLRDHLFQTCTDDTSLFPPDTVPKDLVFESHSRPSTSRMVTAPISPQNDDMPSGIYPHEQATTTGSQTGCTPMETTEASSAVMTTSDVTITSSVASASEPSITGVSGSAMAAAVAAPIMGGLFWLGNRFVNRLGQNSENEQEPSIVVIESSSSESDSEDEQSENDLAFFNAHDNTEDLDSDSDVLTRGLRQQDGALRSLEDDISEIVRHFEAISDIDDTVPQTEQNSVPSSQVKKEANTRVKEVNTSSDKEQKTDENDSSKECVVCCDNQVNSVLYSCGHACLCYDCGQIIKSQRFPTCPICRAQVKDVIRMYQ